MHSRGNFASAVALKNRKRGAPLRHKSSGAAKESQAMKESGRVPAEDMDTQTIGDLVAKDYRAAEVFERYGIDFCCGGKVPLATACREKGIDPEELLRDLEKAAAEPMDRSHNYATWELPFLADYIVNTHHAYLKENTAGIAANAHKIAEVHGAHHPEVIEIARIFDKIAADMALHLREEEEQLFPAIRKIVALEKGGTAHEARDVEELRTRLASLTHEHDEIGAAIHDIRHLAGDYAIPDDVCNTFMVTYRKLKEFEDDLHKHVHLENNILFPKAAKL
jgi:regulator of cell morphogenesis and NO signaling